MENGSFQKSFIVWRILKISELPVSLQGVENKENLTSFLGILENIELVRSLQSPFQ